MKKISKNIILKPLKKTHINKNYLNWFNDNDVKKFITTSPRNLIELKKDVNKNLKEKTTLMFGIFKKSKHIGNVKIHTINYENYSASIGILIGDKNSRGKGYGKHVINLTKKLLLKKNIYIIELGVKKSNKAAFNLYKACNFEIVKSTKDFYIMKCKNFHNKMILGTAQFRSKYGITNKNRDIMNSSEIKKIMSHLNQKSQINEIDTATNYNVNTTDLNSLKKTIFLNNKIHTDENISYLSLKRYFKKNKNFSTNTLFIHDGNNVLSKKGIRLLSKIKKLKKDKIINKIGLSIHNVQHLANILKRTSVDVIQLPYNFVDRRAEFFFPIMKKKRIEIQVRSIFLQGSLLTKIKTNKKLSKLFNEFDTISEKNKIKKIQFALSFILKNKYIDKIIFGVRNYREFIQLNSVIKLNFNLSKLDKFRSNDEEIINPLKWKELILEKKKSINSKQP
jgi:aryl-alcohol dehydrogenase-like predicted oxidoreductase/RimJ/RimL family protein N-acetyltransferase